MRIFTASVADEQKKQDELVKKFVVDEAVTKKLKQGQKVSPSKPDENTIAGTLFSSDDNTLDDDSILSIPIHPMELLFIRPKPHSPPSKHSKPKDQKSDESSSTSTKDHKQNNNQAKTPLSFPITYGHWKKKLIKVRKVLKLA
ncbi:hypothetical protein L2E82_25419 [Cichorium intybus]|uniref:Uncharacterized protein n=1 Tax=Cichorium intybus TaxID=13427 RepID=A0ACB9E3L2_CICIN|nr:hypothetical protein L2E82_25419 [Cichorium intybus]